VANPLGSPGPATRSPEQKSIGTANPLRHFNGTAIWSANPALLRHIHEICYMHACRCGFYGDSTRECRCTPAQIQQYLGKTSGSLLDS
jgi:hypothetical protein